MFVRGFIRDDRAKRIGTGDRWMGFEGFLNCFLFRQASKLLVRLHVFNSFFDDKARSFEDGPAVLDLRVNFDQRAVLPERGFHDTYCTQPLAPFKAEEPHPITPVK
jgi:hypothetical protein